jgi:hypothetical protein
MGAVFPLIAAAYQAKQARDAGAYDAAVASNNAALAGRAAADEKARGQREQNQLGREIRATIGAQRVALAAAGVDPGAGSSTAVLESTMRDAQVDVESLDLNTSRAVFQYGAQAAQWRQQGRVARYVGRQQAIGSLLTGATTAWGNYMTVRG